MTLVFNEPISNEIFCIYFIKKAIKDPKSIDEVSIVVFWQILFSTLINSHIKWLS